MPTKRQELAIKRMVALGQERGRFSKAEVMRQVGYSPATAKHPSAKLTRSKGWNELLEIYLPDDKLLKVHDEALGATKWNDFTGEREPDHPTRLKAVDLGYKVKGRLNETGVSVYGDKVIAILGGITSVHQDNSNQQDPAINQKD